jgi:pentatricopeptide repeat protein
MVEDGTNLNECTLQNENKPSEMRGFGHMGKAEFQKEVLEMDAFCKTIARPFSSIDGESQSVKGADLLGSDFWRCSSCGKKLLASRTACFACGVTQTGASLDPTRALWDRDLLVKLRQCNDTQAATIVGALNLSDDEQAILIKRLTPGVITKVAKAFLRQTTPPKLATLNIAMRQLCRAKAPRQAWKLLQSMKESTVVEPNLATYVDVISASSEAGLMKETRALLENMPHPPSISLVSKVISNYGKNGHLNEALAIFHEMTDAQQSQGISAYIPRSQGCCSGGIKVNTATYNAVITACGNARRLDLARSYFRDMKTAAEKDAAVAPDIITYNALISACGKANRLDEAFEIFDGMKHAGVKANAVTYTAMLSACHHK